jgi:ABC-2 type transport system ATP-binding protein
MESVEEMCDHIALIHKSNKVLDGKLIDVKRQYKSNTYQVGIAGADNQHLRATLNDKFELTDANFKSIDDDLKVNIKLHNGDTSNDLLSYLTSQGQVNHFVEVIPSVNDIFIQTVENNN